MSKKRKKEKVKHEPVDYVKFDVLKRMISSIERDYGGTPEVIDNLKIPFEYIIGSMFPNILDNINKEITKQYFKGFNDRLKIEKMDNPKLLDYPLEYLKLCDSNLAIMIRTEDISDNDKKELKNITEIIESLINNIEGIKND